MMRGADVAEAETDWVNHYRDVTIDVSPFLVKQRRRWQAALIHEILHIKLANMNDFLDENAGRMLMSHVQTLVEQTVSELANLVDNFFYEAYGEDIAKWY